MLIVKSNPLELRGIANKPKKNSNQVYYLVNVESPNDGTAFSLYCPNSIAFDKGLKKGDMVQITFEVSFYNNNERLIVAKVEAVNA